MTITYKTITVKGIIKADLENDLGLIYEGDNIAQIADEFEVFAIGAVNNSISSDFPGMTASIDVRYSTLLKGGKAAMGTFEAHLRKV